MREHGRVIESEDHTVRVAIQATDACEKCPACGMCRPSGGKRYIKAVNEVGACAGDEVLFEISSSRSLVAAMLFFGLPVLLGLFGLIMTAGRSETLMVVIGSAGFFIGLVIAKVINDILATRSAFLPRVIEVLDRHTT